MSGVVVHACTYAHVFHAAAARAPKSKVSASDFRACISCSDDYSRTVHSALCCPKAAPPVCRN